MFSVQRPQNRGFTEYGLYLRDFNIAVWDPKAAHLQQEQEAERNMAVRPGARQQSTELKYFTMQA